jgi:NitT/TauT family transport system permease protein
MTGTLVGPSPVTNAAARTGRGRERRNSHVVRVARWGIVVGPVAALEGASRAGHISPLIMPAPSAMWSRIVEIVPTQEFFEDFRTTSLSVLAAFLLGALAGLPLGILFWRLPFVGATFEPYLVSLYAAPTVVFYPIMLAILGLGPAPIVLLASTMALIPIALNTMVGLNAMPRNLPKLARSLNCSTFQTYWKVLAPAATPLLVPGLVLGFIYATIGVIAMEFIMASRGLGFRIGYYYRYFDMQSMYAYIVVVLVLAVLANQALNTMERRVRKDRVDNA